MRLWLLGLPRNIKQMLLVVTDSLVLLLAAISSYVMRLGDVWHPVSLRELFPAFLAIATALIIFTYRGLYKTVVRYMNASAVSIMLLGVSSAAVVFALSIRLENLSQPRSVPLLFWFVALSLVGGVRLFAQVYLRRFAAGISEPVLIYGAGATGTQLGSALTQGYRHCVIGYVDDNLQLQNMVVHGVRVYTRHHIKALAASYQIRQIFLAVPSATRDQRREILSFLEPLALRVRTLPAMDDVLTGKARIEDVHDVEVDELLGREPVPPQQDLLDACIRDKVVMVTGAGGSIGSELCRQILASNPCLLVLYEIHEFALYQMQLELVPKAAAAGIKIHFILGNVQDKARLREVLRRYGVQTIYHAAAYKHVPMVEGNVIEGVRNNVIGTQVAAEVAAECGVDIFVLISTDKAVRPANVMGASKRLAEMILQCAAKHSTHTRYVMVRFGNVLGSSGSVVPLFMEQIRRGGAVTVTHPEVIRYFMTIREAAQLVVQAGSMALGGDVFLLDMGPAVRIADLARKMIHLAGLHVREIDYPEGDIEIKYIGLRPGEKLYEELLIGGEVSGTRHPRIMRADEQHPSEDELSLMLGRLHELMTSGDEMFLARYILGLASGQRTDVMYERSGSIKGLEQAVLQ
ncbi:MAG: polysaccharide biosynthesis protein [Pseudomonadales bacterium]|nr:polysaccharide biosynthesis protein [Pseudomonadales bacterium]